MRLLVVGHPFILAYNQKKYVAMKQIEPRLRLRIVGPRQTPHLFGNYRCELHPELSAEEVIPLSSALSRSHMTCVLNPVKMARILREFLPDVIHIEEEPQAFLTLGTLALRDALTQRVPVTLFTWDNLHRRRRFPWHAAKRQLRAYSLRRASAIVCGNREAEHLLRTREGYKGLCVVLPQMGLDLEEHAPGNEAGLKQQLGLEDSIVVGYVGRLVPEKGVGLLLSALECLASFPWKLLLVGSGPLERQIHREWRARFPGRIVHVRAIPHREVPRYLRCLDVFVLASYALANWKEQFGLTLAQAMLLGIPSVVSSSGAIPEVAGPGALVFPEGSAEGLREALQSVLRSPSLRRELGARARAFASRQYSLPNIAARYLEVFDQARRMQTMEVGQFQRARA